VGIADQLHDEAVTDMVFSIRYEAGLGRRVVEHLKALAQDLAGLLALDEGIDTKRKLDAILSEAKALVNERYASAEGTFDEELPQFTKIEVGRLLKTLNRVTSSDLFTVDLTDTLLRKLTTKLLIQGAPSAEWWQAQEADTLRRFTNLMRLGMVDGSTGDQLARNVREMMGTSMRNAQALVRTSVISANNALRQEVYRVNSDAIRAECWVATLDPRTCAACGALDGQTWGLDESHPAAPLHWGCRCLLLAQVKSWEQLARENGSNPEMMKKLDGIPAGARASMDGQVPSSMTYQDWLSSKSPEFQRQVLGPARFRLLQSGKLRLSDLTDMRGHELTLKELATL